jgi:hypothetical protein
MPVRLMMLLSVSCALAGCARNSSQPVAMVLGKPIYAADVTPTAEEMRAIHDPEATPAERFREERRARITGRILRPLEARYVRERDLLPTEEEVEQFVEAVRRRNKKIDGSLREELRVQEARHDDPHASEVERADAALRIEALESLIALKNGSGGGAEVGNGGPAMADYEALNQRELAAVWVATWKFHRSLHREFGGAVVWRETGPEPVGAYRRWLEQLERRGDFRIADAELRELFWSYWRRDADVVMDPDVDPFETPWWLEQEAAEASAAAAAAQSSW